MTGAADDLAGPPSRLDGPRQGPARGGQAAALVVLLHGLGADGNDLIGLAPELGRVLPGAAFVSPDAPFPCDLAPYGRQWFSFQSQTATAILSGVEAAAPILDAFLDAELAARGLDDSRLALLGFSQGGMMALHVGLRRARPPAQIIGFSGRLIAPERLASEITQRPPVLLVHGDADEVVPFANLPAAVEALQGAGLEVENAVRPGLGHGIDGYGLSLAAAALRKRLPAAT